MTSNELLMRLNAQMYGTLQQCAAAIDAYFDGLAEDNCEPFIDPAIGALVNSTLNDVERATEEEAREFFDAARRRARDPLGYNNVNVPQSAVHNNERCDDPTCCYPPRDETKERIEKALNAEFPGEGFDVREVPPPDITMADLRAGAKIINDANAGNRHIGVRLTPEEAAAVAGIARYGNGPASHEEIRIFRNLGKLLETQLVAVAEACKA